MKFLVYIIISLFFLFSCNSESTPKELVEVKVIDNVRNKNKTIDSLKSLSIEKGLEGNFQKFKELCEYISQLDSNDIDNLSRLSGIYLINGNYNDGLKMINRSIRLDTLSKFIYNITYKACLYRELQNNDSANYYFDKMLAYNKNNAVHLNSVVEGFTIFKMFDKAREYNNLILKYYPNDEEANMKIAVELFSVNRFNEAFIIINKLCRNTKNSKVYALRSTFYHNLEKYDLALIDADKAVSLSDGEAWIITGRGRTREKLRDYEGAKRDYQEAIKKGDTTALRFYNSLMM
jgi:tetratricopeptide (TPR) repeat protein